MAQTDAPPAEAPAPEAQPPQIQPAPAGQRSTGGERPMEADPKATPLTKTSAQDLLRAAYQKTRGARAEEQRTQPGDQPDVVGDKAPVDKPPKEAVEKASTSAPASDAQRATPARERDPQTGRFRPQDAAPSRPPAAPPSPEPSAPASAEAPAPEPASSPAREAPAPEEPAADFRSERWQAAFADDPGLRRRVARISADPSLAPARKAELLAEKLTESVEQVSQERTRQAQINDFRQRDPAGYARWEQQQEAVAEQNRQLELRITQMIADAFAVDAQDPEFLEAGPQEGDDHETGLQRFVSFTSKKSPVLRQLVQEAVTAREQEVTARYEARIKDLQERHKTALEAAVERARGQARNPFGGTRPPPRTNGTGQRPVGEDDSLQVAQKAPDLSTVRGLIGMGYDQRK